MSVMQSALLIIIILVESSQAQTNTTTNTNSTTSSTNSTNATSTTNTSNYTDRSKNIYEGRTYWEQNLYNDLLTSYDARTLPLYPNPDPNILTTYLPVEV